MKSLILNSLFHSLQQILDIEHYNLLQLFRHPQFIQQYQNIQLFSSDLDIDPDDEPNGPEGVWRSERCGYILEQYANGFHHICNQHKYIHQCDHKFVQPDEIILCEERYLDYLQKQMNHYYHLLLDQLGAIIDHDYDPQLFPQNQLSDVNQWLVQHPHDFKLIFPIHGQIILWHLRE